ncbi:unnamed protein product [Lactuca virosa]|uniref:Uncharacterized protein n=1 Tax=Lactuca virosa TaxID=75947 RepID=A0AAU9N7W8_9ASTR|nr:unnamed protein product [Lactuca virosa]
MFPALSHCPRCLAHKNMVSDRINCGVYVFTPEIFTAIQGVSAQRKDKANLRRQSSFDAIQSTTRGEVWFQTPVRTGVYYAIA